jgi:CHAD domain-containing protein
MHQSTVDTIKAIASVDPETTPHQIEAILAACRKASARRRLGTKRDAAAILGCHPESVKRYARRGLLHPVRITARRVRYDLDEVIRLADHGANAVGDGKAA